MYGVFSIISNEQLVRKDNRLVLAFDKPTRRNANRTVLHLFRRIGGIKLTPEFIRNEDYIAFGALAAKYYIPILYDSNTVHSPSLLERTVDELTFKLPRDKDEKPRSVSAVTISGSIPVEWMTEIVQRARERKVATKLLVVAASPDMTAQQIDSIHRRPPADWTQEVICNARAAGMDGVVASPVDTEGVFTNPDESLTLWAVGLRDPGQEMFGKDPARVCTPEEALQAGADKLIVGNMITQHDDPVGFADDIVKRIQHL